MLFHEQEYDLKLEEKICCPKCNSKRLQINENITASNIYFTNEMGDVVESSVCDANTVNPVSISFVCVNCDHKFRKNKVSILSEVLIAK